jgi:Holliday junction DNA helicase RuvA
MIAFLTGTLLQTNLDSIIVEVNGIGYEVLLHNRSMAALPALGCQVQIYTYLQVLDNDLKLFGFSNKEELDLFKILLSVSGIGARGALSILGVLSPSQFCQVIVSRDEKRLLSVPGIGKKTAQRLVFELKDKLAQQSGLVTTGDEDQSQLADTMEALEALGYQRSEIYPVLMDMKTKGDLVNRVEENVKRFLRIKAKQVK